MLPVALDCSLLVVCSIYSKNRLIPMRVVNRRTYNTVDPSRRTNNDLQSITQKTKDRAARVPLKTGDVL